MTNNWFLTSNRRKVFAILFTWLVSLSNLSLFTSGTAYAQDDFGLDFGLGAETKLAKGLKLELEGGVRTQDNSQRIDRYSLGMDLSYKFFSTIDKRWDAKVFGGFEYLWIQNLSTTEDKYYNEGDNLYPDWKVGDVKGYNETERYWRDRQRYSLGLSLGFNPNKQWSFDLKETFQYSHYNSVDSINVQKVRRAYNDDDEEYWKTTTDTDSKSSKHKTVLRSKLSVTYNIPRCKFDPFASVEYGVGLNYSASRWKFSVGTDYKLTKTQKFTFSYRYNHETDDDEPNGHLVGFGYKFEF